MLAAVVVVVVVAVAASAAAGAGAGGAVGGAGGASSSPNVGVVLGMVGVCVLGLGSMALWCNNSWSEEVGGSIIGRLLRGV